MSCHTGEFGIVYRGLLLPAETSTSNTKPEGVAVKTLKGLISVRGHDTLLFNLCTTVQAISLLRIYPP